MIIDLTVCITPKMVTDAQGNEKKALAGHLGTHFDVMNQIFPLEYTARRGVVFDVSGVGECEIEAEDIELRLVEHDMFVAFYSGFMEKEPYGTQRYFKEHPQLSDTLIDELLVRGVSIIGIDFAGVRRGREHTPKDQYCAERGVFIVENLCSLDKLLNGNASAFFKANTYPMNYAQMTGLPCRVTAEADI